MLYWYGIGLGLRLLTHGKVKYGIRYLLFPVNYWRNVEYKLVFQAGDFKCGERVLDLSSPKLLAIYLAKKIGVQIVATDIEDYFLAEYETIRRVEKVSRENFILKTEDGRALSFGDNSFDKIYAISVLEHIPQDGDTLCMKEMARVLKNHGRCYVTVPFSPEYREQYKKGGFYWVNVSRNAEDGRVFYQRFYPEKELFRRLIEPSGLTPVSIQYVGETLSLHPERELWDYLPNISGPIQPLLSGLFHTRPHSSWEELKKPLCAFMVLEKEVL